MALTDSSGNTFSYRVTRVGTGSGHGTAAACFINGANGYVPGDNTADDDYACINDLITYRVDWNVQTGANQMQVTLATAGTRTPTAATQMTYWWTGIEGGAGLPYTGSTTNPYIPDPRSASAVASTSLIIKANQNATGYFNLTATVPSALNWPTSPGIYPTAVFTTSVVGTTNAASHTAVNDRDVTLLDGSRFDSQLNAQSVDSFNTTINGQRYVGMNASIGIETGNGCIGTAYWPGFATSGSALGTPGYECRINPASTGLRATLDSTAYSNVYFSINNGTPVPALIGADGFPYIDSTRVDDKIKALIPFDQTANGRNNIELRIDPIGVITGRDGTPAFNGLPDPGKGLSCTTTTANVQPGTVEGQYMPNNNCVTFTYTKQVGSGVFAKRDLGITRTVNGQDIPASTYPYIQGNWGIGWSMNPATRIQVSPSSLPATDDFSVCDVWQPGMARLGTGDGGTFLPVAAATVASGNSAYYSTLPAVTTFYPGAQVYYTTLDLRPTGETGAPSCGSPTDGTSGWTSTYPSDPSTVAGVMVVFPGENTLRDDFYVYIPKAGNTPGNYTDLVTNVPNFLGVAPVGTGDSPNWSISDTSSINVIKNVLSANLPEERLQNPPTVGAQTLTFMADAGAFVSSPDLLDDPTALVTIRVYPDRCLSNVTPTTPNTVYVPVAETEIGCGTGNSYVERVMTAGELLTLWGRGNPNSVIGNNIGTLQGAITYTGNTPPTAKPGDIYLNEVTVAVPTNSANFYTDRPTQTTTNRIVIPNAAVVSSSKSTNDPRIHPNQTFTDTVGWFNYTDQANGRAQFIDVLPYNGDDRGTSFHGTVALAAVTYSGEGTSVSQIEYTATPSDLVDPDPNAPSNAAGTTIWCSEGQFGTVVGCPTSMAQVTALRFTTPEFSARLAQFFDLTFTTNGNALDDRYVNSLSLGRISGLAEPLPAPAPVQTVVDDTRLSGNVYDDLDRSGSWNTDTGEPGVANYTVTLRDADGTVVATTTTDDTGYYQFTGLAPGSYSVTITRIDPYNEITQSFTNPDTASGQSGTITLAENQKVTDVDFGLAILIPAIDITKAGEVEGGALVAKLGDGIRYTFTVTNTGDLPLTDVVVSDQMLATGGQQVTCVDANGDEIPGGISLAVGASVQCHASWTVNPADIARESVVNVATVTSNDPGGDPVGDTSNEVEIPTEQAAPSIVLTKSAQAIERNNVDGTNPGDDIQYSFEYTNNGNVTLTNLVLTDPLLGTDATFTCSPAVTSLEPGDTVTCTADQRYTVTDADATAGTVHNTATVAGSAPDGSTVSDDAEADTPVVGTASLALVKSAKITDPADALVARVGDTITFTFTVSNTGTTTLRNLTISDPMLASAGDIVTCESTTLTAAGTPTDSTTCSANYTVTAADVDAGRVDNTATARGTRFDGGEQPSNPSSTSTPAAGSLGIALTKAVKSVTDTNSNNLTDPGDTVVYTFTVTNVGEKSLTEVAVHDDLLTRAGQTVTCAATSLAPGESMSCESSRYTITEADQAAGVVHNVATASGTGPAPDNTLVNSQPATADVPVDERPAPPTTAPPTTAPSSSAPTTVKSRSVQPSAPAPSSSGTGSGTATSSAPAGSTPNSTAGQPLAPSQSDSPTPSAPVWQTKPPLAYTGVALVGPTLVVALLAIAAGLGLLLIRRQPRRH